MTRTDKLFYSMMAILAITIILGISFRDNAVVMSVVMVSLLLCIGLDVVVFIGVLKERKTFKK